MIFWIVKIENDASAAGHVPNLLYIMNTNWSVIGFRQIVKCWVLCVEIQGEIYREVVPLLE